jgi:deferrochelatase/peroxidase EfeB
MATNPGQSGSAADGQSNIVTAPKTPLSLGASNENAPKYRTRDWSLFFFFRIMTQAEMAAGRERLEALLQETGPVAGNGGDGKWLSAKEKSPFFTMKLDLAFPSLLNARLKKPGGGETAAEPAPSRDGPAQAFLDWIKILVAADQSVLDNVQGSGSSPISQAGACDAAEAAASAFFEKLAAADLKGVLTAGAQVPEIVAFLRKDGNYAVVLEKMRKSLRSPLDQSHHGPLARIACYELLRQAAPAFVGPAALPVIRSKRIEDEERPRQAEPFDQTPISLAFSYSGLKALGIHPTTLASFPDVFREGMAARAARLGDTGAGAPENWEGELGLPGIHGYFTGGFNLGMDGCVAESFWKALRAEVRAFNERKANGSADLRAWIGLLFRGLGLEILHIELGQDPYDVDAEAGEARPRDQREEHFGFRDGVSQPFVDLRLGDTKPGGGTPLPGGGWSPIAPGEIFLDQLDESGEPHMSPANPRLRAGSTYLVFRKLEQDVHGFRTFLAQQRPGDSNAQEALAAQFVGRWKNGTPLVRSPRSQQDVGVEADAALNDFRYAADDPFGRKCPLGAHIRRANPRDIGGRNNVRNHRILRRGISYGGPMLARDAADDGEKRGLLFVAANSRIDLQFEVIQADWLNGGEFLGQAGLGRCPISGGGEGNGAGRFLESGALAPIGGIPRFVTMRGGDYFFAPGPAALTDIANGEKFEVDDSDIPFEGRSMADPVTPALFRPERLASFVEKTLTGGKRVIRIRIPPASGTAQPETVSFVGHHKDVRLVLSDKPNGELSDDVNENVKIGTSFSVWPYHEAGMRISRGQEFLVGTDDAGPTCPARGRLFPILNLGWATLAADNGGDQGLDSLLRKIVRPRLEASLRRTADSGHIDLLDDLAVSAAYGVVADLLGVPGPRWLSELAAALPFSRQHVGDLPPDWIAAVKGRKPVDPGRTTMQIWMALLVAGLLANMQNLQALQALSRQAGSEALSHIDTLLAEAFAAPQPDKARTLVDAFIANARLPEIAGLYPKGGDGKPVPGWTSLYAKDLSIILLEIIGATLTIIPLTFSSVMTGLMKFRIDLPVLLARLDPKGVRQLIYETERLNPNSPVRMRRCEVATDLGNGEWIEQGDAVAALITAANLDPEIFNDPRRFSLAPHDPLSDGPERDTSEYLLFGLEGDGSRKFCWGRDRVALPVLEECVIACGRLQGLRRVAGPRGEPQTLVNVPVGLPARFSRIL